MAKYSCETKKAAVKGYLKGEGGRRYVVQKYGINDDSNIRKWVKAYEEFGDERFVLNKA